MVPFYGWGSTVSRLHRHYEEAVYFLPLSSQNFLVLIWSTLEGWKAESTLEPPSGFKHRNPGLGIQHPNHILPLYFVKIKVWRETQYPHKISGYFQGKTQKFHTPEQIPGGQENISGHFQDFLNFQNIRTPRLIFRKSLLWTNITNQYELTSVYNYNTFNSCSCDKTDNIEKA